jgi:hypothetical protein
MSSRSAAHPGPLDDDSHRVPTLREPRYSQSLERGLAILSLSRSVPSDLYLGRRCSVRCGPANPRRSLEQGHGNGTRITITRQPRGTLGRAWQGRIGSTVFENLTRQMAKACESVCQSQCESTIGRRRLEHPRGGGLPKPHHVRRGQIRPRSPTIHSHAQRFG